MRGQRNLMRVMLGALVIGSVASALAGCGSAEAAAAEPKNPPHVGYWFSDGSPGGSSAYLELMPNNEFLFRRVMGSRIIGPAHRGQYRFDDNGNIGLYKYLSQGGLSAAPLGFYRFEAPYMMPLDTETREPKGRHFVRRATLPITILNGENVPDSVLAEASRRASGKD